MNTVKRILIVDDEPGILKLLKHTCETLGWSVSTTSSPEEFRHLSLFHPDLIMMDLKMPGIDGVELFRYLAENQIKVPLILISGSETRVIESAARLAESQGLHILGTLTKPFQSATITELLTQQLPQGQNPKGLLTSDQHIDLNDLVSAMQDGSIRPYFQPQVELNTNETVSCEALARWVHPVKGMIMPDHFIPLTETSGAMNIFTDHVIRETLKQCAQLDQMGFGVRCSINVSASTLTDITFPDRLTKMIETYSVKPGSIVVEITESRIFSELVKTMDVLTRLRLKGIELSIDDFGTGYSTFSQLHDIPFSELKIDKSFVASCKKRNESESIVRASIDLAKRLSMRTVAEGVETQEVAHILHSWGCDLGQGYLYAKALSSQDLVSWLTGRKNPE